jgi:hypothetical protein
MMSITILVSTVELTNFLVPIAIFIYIGEVMILEMATYREFKCKLFDMPSVLVLFKTTVLPPSYNMNN